MNIQYCTAQYNSNGYIIRNRVWVYTAIQVFMYQINMTKQIRIKHKKSILPYPAAAATTNTTNTTTTANNNNNIIPIELTRFQRRVLALCKHIPLHKVTTYKSMSIALTGTYKSCRAIGNVLRNNPYAPLVPCHRIIASNYTLGGFMGRTDINSNELQKKICMLQHESIVIHHKIHHNQYTVDPSCIITQSELNYIAEQLNGADCTDSKLLEYSVNDYSIDLLRNINPYNKSTLDTTIDRCIINS